MRQALSIGEAMAVESLIRLAVDLCLLVDDDEDSDYLHTTGETLNLESFDREEWATLLNLINE